MANLKSEKTKLKNIKKLEKYLKKQKDELGKNILQYMVGKL